MTDTLAKLFGSAARVKLLRLFLFNPRESISAAEAAAHARVEPATARREITNFCTIGLVKRAGRVGRTRYTLNPKFRYLAALQGLLLNAPARASDLEKRLKSAGGLKMIIMAGVFVGDWDGRLDLLVVGDRMSDRVLRGRIRGLEAELGKEIRYSAMSTQDFFYRLNMSDKLLRDVLDYPHAIAFDRLNIGLK
ncbi:MAG: hypothetical protein AAB964_00055 [Patescibacteria group bacterium]